MRAIGITISVGRNIGTGEPLSEERWLAFRDALVKATKEAVLDAFGPDVYGDLFLRVAHLEDGEYRGVAEESWVLTASIPFDERVENRLSPSGGIYKLSYDGAQYWLRRLLGSKLPAILKDFEQEAAYFLVGPASFVTATDHN